MSDKRVSKDRFRSSIFGFRSDLPKTEAQVVHLYITKEPVKKKKRLQRDHESSSVFSQDLHICGTCMREFTDIFEFLLHKVEHSLGKDLFRCDLCKVVVSSKELLLDHYDTDHRLSSIPKCNSKSENETLLLSNGPSVNANGISIESNPPTTLDKSPPATEFPPGNSSKSNNGKRKSKLQVKPMLESGILEEDIEQPCLFDQGFQKLEGDGEFAMSDNVESNDNDEDFTRTVANAENGIGTKDSCVGQKVRNRRTTEPFDFDFLHILENGKQSRFSHTQSWLQCLHCDYRTRRESLLSSHMSKRHKDLKGRSQISDSHVKRNLLQGHKIMRMSAYEATLGSSKRSLLTKHQRFLEKPDISGAYPCTMCGKAFSRFRYLRKHLEAHQTEKLFVCDDCGKSFKSRTHLGVHRRLHLQKKEFSCNQCNFVSSINAAIHAHRQIHNSGSVICDICGYAYTDRSTLGKHKRVHDLSRPFACNFPGCKWRFKTEVMCRAHFKAHTTQGKFRCSVCGYIFRHKHHLQRHELHMHRVKSTHTLSSNLHFSAAAEAKEFSVNDDSDNFLPLSDLEMLQDLSSDLPTEFNQSQLLSVQDSDELPINFISADLSISNVDCELLGIEDLTCKEEDRKRMLASELEVFN